MTTPKTTTNPDARLAFEPIVRLRRAGLANTPSDCAEQLALVSDAMMQVAQEMSWVAQYATDIDPDMRKALTQHAREMDGAAKLAESWANAIVAA